MASHRPKLRRHGLLTKGIEDRQSRKEYMLRRWQGRVLHTDGVALRFLVPCEDLIAKGTDYFTVQRRALGAECKGLNCGARVIDVLAKELVEGLPLLPIGGERSQPRAGVLVVGGGDQARDHGRVGQRHTLDLGNLVAHSPIKDGYVDRQRRDLAPDLQTALGSRPQRLEGPSPSLPRSERYGLVFRPACHPR